MIYEIDTPEEMMEIGRKTAALCKKGDIFCLTGDLGAGKTVFSKGFALGLGIKAHITSPTFTIINEYHEGRLEFYHFDVYRLGDADELYDLGYEEYFFGGGVCLIEWADNVCDFIPENAVWINIEKNIDKGEGYRRIEIKERLG